MSIFLEVFIFLILLRQIYIYIIIYYGHFPDFSRIGFSFINRSKIESSIRFTNSKNLEGAGYFILTWNILIRSFRRQVRGAGHAHY